MSAINISFAAVPDTNPINPTGDWLSVGPIPARISGGKWLAQSSNSAVWIYNKPYEGTQLKSTVVLGAVNGSDSQGPCIVNASGNGYLLLVRSVDVRLFLINAGVLGTQVGSNLSTTFANDDQCSLTYNPGTGAFTVLRNGTQITTFTSTVHTTNMRPGLFSRGPSGIGISSASVEDFINSSVDTMTNPVSPGAAFSGTCTGFANGAATITCGSLSAPVTITGTSFAGVWPALGDNMVYPTLPASGLTVTLTQGAIVGSLINVAIDLPAGHDVTRNETTLPSNFSNIISDDITYLANWFSVAGNPLTTADRAIFPTANGFKIFPNSGIEINSSVLPEPVVIYIQRGADGKVYQHTINISEVLSTVVLDLTGWTEQSGSPRWDGAFPHSVRP